MGATMAPVRGTTDEKADEQHERGLMVLFDPGTLGKRLRGARQTAGFESVEKVNEALGREYNVTYSTRGLLAIERGEQVPTFDQFMTLVMLYSPPGGFSFFYGAVREQYRGTFRRLFEDA